MVSKPESQALQRPSPVLPELWRGGERKHYRQEMQRRRTCREPPAQERLLHGLRCAAHQV